MTLSLADKLVAIHRSLRAAGVPHAFGGALALAWCTVRARGTVDIDVNLFVHPTEARATLGALPAEVSWSEDDVALLERDGQARLRWGETPVDVFFNTTEFHAAVAAHARHEPFRGEQVPFLACRDLAVFKAFFNRTRDWADLEDMAAANTLDADAVLGVLVNVLGGDDGRVARLRTLTQDGTTGAPDR